MSSVPLIRVADLESAGVLAIDDGYRVTNKELGPAGIPFVRGGNIGHHGEIDVDVADHVRPEFAGRVSSKLSKPGDVAFITKGTVGRVGLLRANQPQVVFAPQVCFWRSLAPERLVPRFIYYLLRSAEFQANLDAVRTHGAMAADYVSLADQRRFLIALPDVAQQRLVARILGALDDKIDLNRRTNETFEAMARAIFQSWFVDFDPVRAKIDAKQPAGMHAETTQLFPGAFTDSIIGPIPETWRADRLDALVELRRGHDLPATARSPGVVPIVSSGGISGAHDVSQAKAPGIVTGRYGTIGKVFLMDEDYWPLNTTLYSSDLKGNTPSFVFHSLSRVDFEKYSDKGAVPGINRNHLHMEPVLIPPVVVQQAFSRNTDLWRAAARQLGRTSAILAALRDTLLPKLLSGELRVPDAERAIADAV